MNRKRNLIDSVAQPAREEGVRRMFRAVKDCMEQNRLILYRDWQGPDGVYTVTRTLGSGWEWVYIIYSSVGPGEEVKTPLEVVLHMAMRGARKVGTRRYKDLDPPKITNLFGDTHVQGRT